MLIRLSREAAVDDFCFYFTRAGFLCEPVGGVMVEVARPDAPTAAHERRDVEAHLLIWHEMHPRFPAVLAS